MNATTLPALGETVRWTPVPETQLYGQLIAYSCPEYAWVRWSGDDDDSLERVDELAAL